MTYFNENFELFSMQDEQGSYTSHKEQETDFQLDFIGQFLAEDCYVDKVKPFNHEHEQIQSSSSDNSS